MCAKIYGMRPYVNFWNQADEERTCYTLERYGIAMEDKKINKKKGLIIGVVILGVILGFRYILPYIFPFFIAFFLGELLAPYGRWLSIRLGVGTKVASVIALLSAGLLVVLFIWGFLRIGVGQVAILLQDMPDYRRQLMIGVEDCCLWIDRGFGLQPGRSMGIVLRILGGVMGGDLSGWLSGVTKETMVILGQVIEGVFGLFVTAYATLFFIYKPMRLPEPWQGVKQRVVGGIWGYLRTEGMLLGIQTAIIWLGLSILGCPYNLLLAIIIGVLDMLPFLGSGIIFIPWGIAQLLLHHVGAGIGLLVLWVVCLVTRELLEPKLLGKQLRMGTLTTLLAMYIGYRLLGIWGILFGSIGYLITRELVREAVKVMEERG